jgi:hypothetical protein
MTRFKGIRAGDGPELSKTTGVLKGRKARGALKNSGADREENRIAMETSPLGFEALGQK